MEGINKKTLESYEGAIDEYIQNTSSTRNEDIKHWIDKSLQTLDVTAKILEIGSASGVDAQLIEEKGYTVEKTDAIQGFVSLLQKSDPTARILNVLTDEIDSYYDLIIANAVFLHFTEMEMETAVSKVYNALAAKGIFSLTLKEGEGEFWQDNKDMPPRFFRYWLKEDIIALLTEIGFVDIDAWIVPSGSSGAQWIMIVARKP